MGFNVASYICGYDNISSKFDFQGSGLKVMVDMTEIFSIRLDLGYPSKPEI